MRKRKKTFKKETTEEVPIIQQNITNIQHSVLEYVAYMVAYIFHLRINAILYVTLSCGCGHWPF